MDDSHEYVPPLAYAPPGARPARAELETLAVSRARFGQLAVYVAACVMTAINWNIVVRLLAVLVAMHSTPALTRLLALLVWEKAPVYAIAEARFDVGVQQVNSLSNAWNIYSAPGAVLALWVTARFGLRASLLVGFASQALCALMAHGSVTLPWPPHNGFALLYASQLIGAVGQALYLNNVTLLAGTWFPSSERDIAVAASLLCVALGSVFISVYAPWAVKEPDELNRLFGWQVPAWLAILVAGLLVLREQPPHPPSVSAAMLRANAARRRASRSRAGDGDGDGTSSWSAVGQALALCGHVNFMVLNMSSALLTGLVMMLATMVGQVLAPCGHGNDVAGSALAALSAASGASVGLYLWLLSRNERRRDASLASSPGGGPAVSSSRSYVAHQVGWSALCAGGIALTLGASPLGTTPGDTAAVIAAWGVLGLLSGTLLNGALTMEHAAEMTFPLPANVSVSVLAVTGSAISFAQVIIGTHLLQAPAVLACKSATGFAGFCALCAGAGLLLACLLKPEYRRARAETAQGEDEEGSPRGGERVSYGTL